MTQEEENKLVEQVYKRVLDYVKENLTVKHVVGTDPAVPNFLCPSVSLITYVKLGNETISKDKIPLAEFSRYLRHMIK